MALLLDGAGWHRSPRLALPDHLHLLPLPLPLPLPPYSPELQPADRLWRYTNTPLVNAHFADLEALDDAQWARCSALQTNPSLVATIHAATHFHWWPADYSPTT